VITSVTPLAAAIIGGTVMGMGLLAVTRHGTAVGGSTMIARWLSVKKGWNFGRLMMAGDAMIIGSSFLVLSPQRALWSLLSAVCMNLMLMTWHRPDRYLAQSR
jgi:uncharacterized membrane-anchored protein YitT (DUF2179 family)